MYDVYIIFQFSFVRMQFKLNVPIRQKFESIKPVILPSQHLLNIIYKINIQLNLKFKI